MSEETEVDDKTAELKKRFQRLLEFLGEKEFELPWPLANELRPIAVAIGYHEIDVARVAVEPSAETINVFTTSAYPRIRGTHELVPMFDDFLELAVSILANRAHNKVAEALKVEESARFQKRVELRLRASLGFLPGGE